jgi:hypothetical protein
MEKEILEGNKLIAEFMGWKKVCAERGEGVTHLCTTITDYFGKHEYWINDPYIEPHLFFNSNWNWLMPVVEKIAKTKMRFRNVEEDYYSYPVTFGMSNEEGDFMVRLYCGQLFSKPKLIEAAFLAVVDFIKLYNEPNPEFIQLSK